ncbi:hypothetical protein FGW37_31050 [Streptomyces rectiverticillatus]|uniref:alpha/beta hydrolase n=1 Tax=Streptomyces rectiverticillatus TaxID=173860 RepID=UPI0015C32BBE|nr:alpha/beta hydrolase [Streptomyces rectiverticillatus]QLE75434.1 hypothetical protein FGW37_31050 [Streptomyces rectiverticillatus]
MIASLEERYRANSAKLIKDLGSPKSTVKKNAEYVQDALKLARDKRLEPRLFHYDSEVFSQYGRAVITVGTNLEDAECVAFVVPGTTHWIGTISQVTKAALHLYEECKQNPRKGTKKVCVLAWMGYKAPARKSSPGCTTQLMATDGCKHLIADVDFLKKLFTDNKKPMPRLTLSGHSYGSVVVGFAARQKWSESLTGGRSGAQWCDALVLLGSPGAGATTANGLGFNDSVFVGSVDWDPISLLAAYGTDPAHKKFGGRRFKTTCKLAPQDTLMANHKHYFDEKSDSLANIARIVVGDIKGLETVPHRNYTSRLSFDYWWCDWFPEAGFAYPQGWG